MAEIGSMAEISARSHIAPFLIRIFSKYGSFHELYEFQKNCLPHNENFLYGWKDMTLGELGLMLAKTILGTTPNPLSSHKFHFRLIYGDNERNRLVYRDIGIVRLGEKSRDHDKTLEEAQFVIGDWIDVAVLAQDEVLHDSNARGKTSHHRGRGSYNSELGSGRGRRRSSLAARQDMEERVRKNGRPYGRLEGNDRRGRGADSHNWANDAFRG